MASWEPGNSLCAAARILVRMERIFQKTDVHSCRQSHGSDRIRLANDTSPLEPFGQNSPDWGSSPAAEIGFNPPSEAGTLPGPCSACPDHARDLPAHRHATGYTPARAPSSGLLVDGHHAQPAPADRRARHDQPPPRLRLCLHRRATAGIGTRTAAGTRPARRTSAGTQRHRLTATSPATSGRGQTRQNSLAFPAVGWQHHPWDGRLGSRVSQGEASCDWRSRF